MYACLKKNRTATINNFINSQHLLIIFGTERLYSILNYGVKIF